MRRSGKPQKTSVPSIERRVSIQMRHDWASRSAGRRFVVLFACLLAYSPFAQATDYYLGEMKANSILFLGNSITMTPGPYPGWSDVGGFGMSASAPEKDYVHLLTSSIDDVTGGTLTINPPSPAQTPTATSSTLPTSLSATTTHGTMPGFRINSMRIPISSSCSSARIWVAWPPPTPPPSRRPSRT